VRIGDELFDAQSTGDYIARGAPVTVVGAMGSSLVVESAAAATPGRDTPRERKEAES
jgi:membrane-bound ClpP family serine protease